jgi:hypothetical protein
MRTRIVPYIRLLDQADTHWEFAHGKTREDAMTSWGFPSSITTPVSRHATRFDPGRFSGAVAMSRTYIEPSRTLTRSASA